MSVRLRSCRDLSALALLLTIVLASAGHALGATYYVDGASSSCSPSGPGTSPSVPYCTISAAASARGGPGTILNVRPATYREQVDVDASGASGSPFIIRADGGLPTVSGADDFSGTSKWTLLSGDVYRASTVTWSPQQVFSDGVRLTPWSGSPASLPSNFFVYVSGQGLYVNVGGGNPGSHALLVGHRSNAFRISGNSWVNIEGFRVMHTEDRSIYVKSGSSNCEIRNNIATLSNKYGIALTGVSNILVMGNVVSFGNDHGIYLSGGTTGSTVQDNESFSNARPAERAANGIQLNQATNNILQGNRLHDNQDTGLHLSSSSNNNLSRQNRSWNNGDHGFDHLESTGNVHIGDVSFGNFKDGMSIEGGSSGTTVVNCILVDSGITQNEYDLWVSSDSQSGHLSDYNIIWNSTSQQPIKWGSTIYSTVSAFCAATGHDCHSTQATPRFVNPSGGDFHLQAASPAIDSANSSITNWPPTDAEGRNRFDDTGVPNTGQGPPITFADRGALEFNGTSGANQAPNGVIDTPPQNLTISAGQAINFTATASDPDSNTPFTYLWTFGAGGPANRTVEDPGNVVFATTGTFTVTFTVTDLLGLPDPTPDSRVITVNPNQAPESVIDAPAGNVATRQGGSVVFMGTGSDPENHTPFTYLWNMGGGATNRTVEDPGAVVFGTLGTYTVSFTVTDSLGKPDLTPDTRVVLVEQAPDGTILTPNGTPSPWPIYTGQTVNFTATAIDPDNNLPLTYLWNFGGGAANSTALSPGPVLFSTPGTFTVTFNVTDSLGVSDPGPGQRIIQVSPNTPPNGTIISPATNPTITAGEGVSFTSQGTDPENHTPLKFNWNFGGGATNSTAQNPGNVVFATPGTYTVTLTVQDSIGLADPSPDSRIVTANPNQAPSATIDSPPGDVLILVGQNVSFQGTGSDPDNNVPLTFSWNFGGGAPSSTLEDPGSVTFATAGTYTVTFGVTDRLGLGDPTPATRVITVNTPPVATIDAPAADVSLTAGDSVTFAGSGTDPDGNIPLTFLWNFGAGGPSGSTAEDPGSVTFPTPGTYTVSFVVTDSRGTSCLVPDTVVVTVAPNQEPNGAIDAPAANTSIYAGDVVSFSGTGTDPDNNLPLTYLWNFGGGAANSTLEDPGNILFANAGTYTVTFTVTDRLGVADSSPATRVIDVMPNSPPDGTILTPTGDRLVLVGHSLDFTGAASDPENHSPFHFAWSFGGGASGSTAQDPGTVVFATPGTYTVTLTVTDRLGAVDPTPASLVVTVNQEPNGTIDTPAADLTMTVGDVRSFTGTAVDPDGNTPLTFLWNFGGGAANTTVEDPGDVLFATPGTYTVTFTVTDSRGTSDPTPGTRVITVAANTPPNGVIETPAADPTITAGAGVAFTGTGSDPDGNTPLTYLWDFGGGAANSTIEDPGSTVFATPGTYTVTFHVTDSLGLADPTPAQRIVTVETNDPPAGTIDTPLAAEVILYQGETASFTGTGTDPNDDTPLSFLWDFGGGAASTTVEDPGEVLFTTPGIYTVTFTATDNLGLSDPTPDSRVVQVLVNSPPNGTIDLPATDPTILSGEEVIFQGSGSDTEGHTPLTFLWHFGSGGPADSTAEDPGAVSFPTPGTYTVTLTVTDRLGMVDPTPAARIVTVENRPPNGTIDTPAAAVTTIFEGQSVSFSSSASDYEGHAPFTYLWHFGSGGPANSTVEDPGTVIFPTAGTYTVTLTVTDALGGVDPTPDARTVIVDPNQAPNAVIDAPSGNVAINPGQSVSFQGTGNDPENHTPFTYLWTFGGEAADSTVEDPGDVAFHTPGTHTVTFTVTDALALADPTPATRLVRVNHEPDGTITSPPGGTTTIAAGQSVSFTGTGSDTDGDTPLSFAWSFGGGAPSSTLQDPGAVTFATPGTYTVTFTVTDSLSLADSTPATRVIVVGGRPNGVIDAPAGNVSIAAGQSVSFEGTGTDPNNHTPLSYLWTFDPAGPANRFVEDPGAVTFPNIGTYTVTFTVTNSLGFADLTPDSRVITVAPNAAPNGVIDAPAANVTIHTGQSVSFQGTGSDPDNVLPLTYLWTFGAGGPANRTAEDPGSVTFLSPGTYTVTFTVTDALGLSDPVPDTRVITVDPNQAPNSVIDAPSGDMTIAVGHTVTFQGTGTDPDNDTPLTYLWTFGAGGPANSTVEDPAAVTFPLAGTYTATFTVTDALGLADPTPATRVITVSPNQAPNGAIDAPSGNVTIVAGQSVTFQGTGTDADTHIPLSYLWTFGAGGPANRTVEDPGAVTFPVAGTYTATFTVTDALGLADPTPATRVITVNNAAPTIVEKRVVLGADDAEDQGSSTSLSSSDLELTVDSATQVVGMRFTVLALPKNATITAAWIQFTADESHSGTTNLTFQAQAIDTAPVFTSAANNISSRARTAASVAWSPGAWTAGQAIDAQKTPSLTAVIQEIVNRPGWASGNALAIIVTGTGTRTAVAFEGSAAQAPLLHVEYATGPQPNQAPNGTIDTPSGNVTVTVGQSVSFTGTATDPDNTTPLTYLWTFGAGGPANRTVEDPGAVAFPSLGTFTVTFTVTDGLGLADPTPATRVVTVSSNQAPNGTIDTPAGNVTISPGGSVSFTGTATDPDNTIPLTYLWTFGAGGPANRTVEDPGAVTFPSLGTFTVTFTVTDGLGLADPTPATRVVTVSSNQAPNGTIDTPAGNVTITAGQSVSLTGTATDPDNTTPLTYLWTFGAGGPANRTVEDPGAVTFPAAGTYTTTFTVTDALGLADPTPATRVITVNNAGSTIVEKRVVLGADDAEDQGSSTSLSSSDLELTVDSVTQVVGMRFTALALPNNAAITAAWIQFTADESHSGTTNLTFQAQAIDTAPVFTSAANNISSRARTAASVAWSPGAWTAGQAIDAQKTPSLTAVIQEIVNRPGWASGNALAIIVTGTGTRTAVAFEGSAAQAPLLHVEYATGPQPNQAPNGTIDTPSGNVTITVGQSVSFTGTATDPDNTTPLTYLWTFGAGGPANRTVEDPGAVAFPSLGTFTVTFTVTDGLGLADPTPATRVVTVNPNQAPNGTIDTPAGNVTISPGGSVSFTGTATDPDSTIPLTYLWTFGAGGPANSTVEDPGAVTFPSLGTYTVTFTVTDGLGLADSTPATRVVTVANNQAPNGTIDTPAGNVSITAGQSVSFTGTGTDPDNNTPLTYLWTFGAGGPANRTVEDPGAVTFPSAGTFTVNFTVTDGLGSADPTPATRVVTVSSNQAPNGTIDTPAGNVTISPGGSVSFTGTATDPDNTTPLTYLWTFGAGGPANRTVEDPGAVTFPSAGTFTVTFTVTDNLGSADPTPATRVVTVSGGGGTNLVTNPSFESGTTGWNAYGVATIAQDTSAAQDGSACLSMTGPNPAADFGVNDSPNVVPNSGPAGTRYRYSAWIRTPTSGSHGAVRIKIREYNAGVQVGSSTILVPPAALTSTWTQISIDHVTGAAGSFLDVQFINTPAVVSEVFQIDNISVSVVP